ncbi:DNA replication factor Cdt1 isoform X2 [Thrips palmi]|uniref:DNA replication factor Cdt1 isoform X2 n=1 Tax=Thrips palmi TaxID=161013 RepID=A0A6P8ZZY4_THRPL|nr:DNA replication factor Cdt1 isoform X2 [Thrips palmi]
MAQSTIDTFFANRKRHAADDLKGKSSKIIALESDSITAGYGHAKSNEISGQTAARIKVEATVVFPNDDAAKPKPQPPRVAACAPATPKARTPVRARRATKAKDSQQTDMKSFLRSVADAKPESETKSLPAAPAPASTSVPTSDETKAQDDELASAPVEEPTVIKEEPNQEDNKGMVTIPPAEVGSHVQPAAVVPNDDVNVDKMALEAVNVKAATKESNIQKARKELSLGDIKSKLTRSARLAELKASLARFDEGRNKLVKIEEAKQTLLDSNSTKPQLAQFSTIQLEVPSSPSKSPMKSPMKSPQKCLAGSRSPAFQRYSSLAQSEKLPLPHNYRHLAELFRCMEGVVSMYFNRKEIITFRKLQPSVQNMGHKNFTINHLAQIVTVFPEAYSLKQEKVHSFASPTKHDKYHLVILPVLKSDNNLGKPSMTPSEMNERQQRFFKNLLDIVKKHHEIFLQTLNPPIVIPAGMLTRWHPEFAVDQVPDLPRAPLPQPPNLEKCSSAKDVLAKAKQLISCNPRMEKALASVAQSNTGLPQSTTDNITVDPPAPNNPPTPVFKNMQLLKGIPNSLLEKVRAKQAAKAMEAMTRTKEQDNEAIQYARLPEIARILRCVFVTEKKGSLPLEFVLEKVNNSYRSSLSHRELEEHIKLLAKAVPGWVSFDHLLKTEYLKLSKKGDMNRVMNRLNELASSK